MVVLTEELHGLSLKRKGGHEAGLFDDDAGAGDRSGFSLSCRATKMRRLACSDDQAAATAAAWEDDDVAMGEDGAAAAAAPSPSPGDDERAVVVYGDGDSGSDRRRIDAPRLRADWIRAMLREADSRTVRELLAGAARLEHGSEHDLALAVVPWLPPTPADSAAVEEEEEAAADGAAAMDVEGQEGRPWTWTGQGQATQAAYGDAAGEGLLYRWSQHCWAPPAPAVAQASPVVWSW